jgi:hypothetical protein
LALDGVGLIPGAEFADLANAAISLARGNYTDAGLSLAACVPILGNLATAGKLTKKAKKLYEAGKMLGEAKYPGKFGKTELHHIFPKYLGGS